MGSADWLKLITDLNVHERFGKYTSYFNLLFDGMVWAVADFITVLDMISASQLFHTLLQNT